MDKKWRPQDWCYDGGNASHPEIGEAFESGASAMLEVLEKTAVCDIVVKDRESIRINIGDLGKYNWQNGVWYFIPR